MNKPTDKKTEELISDFKEGAKAGDLSKKYGLSASAIYATMSKHGVVRDKPLRKKTTKTNTIRINEPEKETKAASVNEENTLLAENARLKELVIKLLLGRPSAINP